MSGLASQRLNLRDSAAPGRRRPLLIAHRGAAGPGVPENTLPAIEAAAAAGYDLVEIDVEVTRDGVPVLFHHDRDGTMWAACGVDASVRTLTHAELAAVQYRASGVGIPTLEDALATCAVRGLGVVLDLKVAPAPGAYLRQIGELLDRFQLADATLLLSEDPEAAAALAHLALPIAPRRDHSRALSGEAVFLAGQFWPAFADRLGAEEVTALHAAGALVVATVAPGRYPPHAHRTLAAADICRLIGASVDAFLIDDDYRRLVRPAPPVEACGMENGAERTAPAGLADARMAGEPLVVVPYDPTWPALFREQAAALRAALGGVALRIDHIGSTSVPALAAKPIIDVQISVADFEPLDAYRAPLLELGYVHRADNPERTKRYFREAPGQRRTHIHVRRAGSFSEQLALLFRDFLRAHPDEVVRYGNLKRELAARHQHDRHAYTDAKEPFIWETVRQADAWAHRTGWVPGPSDA